MCGSPQVFPESDPVTEEQDRDTEAEIDICFQQQPPECVPEWVVVDDDDSGVPCSRQRMQRALTIFQKQPQLNSEGIALVCHSAASTAVHCKLPWSAAAVAAPPSACASLCASRQAPASLGDKGWASAQVQRPPTSNCFSRLFSFPPCDIMHRYWEGMSLGSPKMCLGG